MSATQRVRSFNRTVTQRVGALHDEYLARGRPLGASRVLWEVGEEPVDVRALRARLDLDSGYLSRLLRALEGEGLVVVAPGTGDRRVRTVRLTPAGHHVDLRVVTLPSVHGESVVMRILDQSTGVVD